MFICTPSLCPPAVRSSYPPSTSSFKGRIHSQVFDPCLSGNHTTGSRSSSVQKVFEMEQRVKPSLCLSRVGLPWSSFLPDPLLCLETQLVRGGLGFNRRAGSKSTIILGFQQLSSGISICCCSCPGTARRLQGTKVKAMAKPDCQSQKDSLAHHPSYRGCLEGINCILSKKWNCISADNILPEGMLAMELNLHVPPELETSQHYWIKERKYLGRSCTYNLHFRDG